MASWLLVLAFGLDFWSWLLVLALYLVLVHCLSNGMASFLGTNITYTTSLAAICVCVSSALTLSSMAGTAISSLARSSWTVQCQSVRSNGRRWLRTERDLGLVTNRGNRRLHEMHYHANKFITLTNNPPVTRLFVSRRGGKRWTTTCHVIISLLLQVFIGQLLKWPTHRTFDKPFVTKNRTCACSILVRRIDESVITSPAYLMSASADGLHSLTFMGCQHLCRRRF